MTTTKLYLDVDGVINVFPKHGRNKTGWEFLSQTTAAGFRITWSEEMLERLTALGMELVWTTTWQEYAPRELAPKIDFGVGSRWLSPPPGFIVSYPTIDWKYAAVKLDQIENPSPFVWIDDEMERVHRVWAAANGGLALRTYETQGITPQMIEAISNFLDSIEAVPQTAEKS